MTKRITVKAKILCELDLEVCAVGDKIHVVRILEVKPSELDPADLTESWDDDEQMDFQRAGRDAFTIEYEP